MQLRNPEVVWLWPVLIVATAALVTTVVRARRHRPGLPLAHLDRLRALPRYQALIRRQRVAALSAVVLIVAGVILSGLASARPQETTTVQPPHKSRDVMLCLDVSGSMSDVDARLMDIFAAMSSRMRGDRIGLTVFNQNAVTVIPLTDDQEFLARELRRGAHALRTYDWTYTAGTVTAEGGSSLTPDGLASCVDRFDRVDEDRPRSIVLASDNEVNGRPIFTMPQATHLARESGIRVYALNPGWEDDPGFRAAVESTQGAYVRLDDPDLVGAVVRRITAEEARRTHVAPRTEQHDNPAPVSAWLVPTTLLALLVLKGVRR